MSLFLKFPISTKTEKQINDILIKLNEGEKIKSHNKEIANIVNSVIDEGMEYYFIKTIKRLKINPIIRKPFELGVNTSIRGLKIITPKILRVLSEKQLKEAVNIIDEMLLEEE